MLVFGRGTFAEFTVSARHFLLPREREVARGVSLRGLVDVAYELYC